MYYAQFKHIDDVEYYVEHYFEQPDGTYALYSTDTLYAKPETVVTATALDPRPEGFKEENTAHADRVSEGTVPEKPDVLTLKLYYYSKVITVRYFDLAYDAEEPVYEYEVKYGGTVDNFTYPGTEYSPEDNEDIKTELAEYLEYLTIPGYGKDYDEAYFYNKFEDELDGYYYYEFGKNGLFEHEINYKWYVEDAELEYVLFDEAHEFTEDLDLFSKVKKLNVVIGFPTKLTDKVLTINIPYEESTRFLDSIRDALFINNQSAGFPELIGIEDKLYDKLSDVGTKFFGEDGIFNSDNEINNVNMLVRFSRLMGEAAFEAWLEDLMEEGGGQTVTEFLKEYISENDEDSIKAPLKKLFNALIKEKPDVFISAVKGFAEYSLGNESETHMVEQYLKDYVQIHDSADDISKLSGILANIFHEYEGTDHEKFVEFATGIALEKLEHDLLDPEHADSAFINEVKGYILNHLEENAASDYSALIEDEITELEDEQFKNIVNKIITN